MIYILERISKVERNKYKPEVFGTYLKLELENFSEVFRVGEVIRELGDVTLDTWNHAKKYADANDGVVLYTKRYSTNSVLDGELVVEYILKNTEGPEELEEEDDLY